MLMTDEGWCEKNCNMFRKLLNRDLIKNWECNDPDIITKFRMQLLVICITKDNVVIVWQPNPLTPLSDQDRISPYNVNTISTI